MVRKVLKTVKFPEEQYYKIIRAIKTWPDSWGKSIPSVIFEMLNLASAPDIEPEDYHKYRLRDISTNATMGAPKKVPQEQVPQKDNDNYMEYDTCSSSGNQTYIGRVHGVPIRVDYLPDKDRLCSDIYKTKTRHVNREMMRVEYEKFEDEETKQLVLDMIRKIKKE